MTENQRLKEVQQALGFKSQTAFAQALGIKQGSLSDIYRQRRGVGISALIKMTLSKVYAINIEWLETGAGDMFLPSLETEEQPASSACPPHNEDDTTDSKVPLLPLEAKAGSLSDFVLSVKLADCEKIVSPIRNIDFAITVKGDSMSPKIPSKSKVFIKKIDHSRFIEWGEIYVLDTCNGTIIKKIMPTEDPSYVKCVSLNSNYPPFEISLLDIYGMYQVLLVMTEI